MGVRVSPTAQKSSLFRLDFFRFQSSLHRTHIQKRPWVKGAAIPILRMSAAHSCTLSTVFQPVRGQGHATESSARHTAAPSAGDQPIGLLYILVIITTFAVSPAQEHHITVY